MVERSFSPKLQLIKGAAWSLVTRWSIRVVGFINTVVMARLVLPSDYGVVAMAFLVVGLIQALMDFSATTALLRKGEVTRDEVDSAWTLRGIQGVAMAAVMVILIPFAGLYFKDERVAGILLVFAFCLSISGFSNIGLTLAQKSFNFGLEFRFSLASKVLSVILTIAFGWWFRDYRALVAGIASGYIGGVVLSYMMHPYRPRWNTSEIHGIWRLTRWLMVANVAGFILRKGDELIAARVGTASDFGYYNVGSDLGQMPAGEIGPAIIKSFLPVLAAMDAKIDEINQAVIKTLRVVASITFPIGLGFAAIAGDATNIILGSAWVGASEFVAVFAVLGAVQVLGGPLNSLLTFRGHTKSISYAVWIEFLIFLMSAFLFLPSFGLLGLVFARISGSLGSLVVLAYTVRDRCGVGYVPILNSIARPGIGAILMYFFVLALSQSQQNAAFRLLLGILTGVTFYSVWSLVSWRLMGRPVGLESIALDLIKNILHKKGAR